MGVVSEIANQDDPLPNPPPFRGREQVVRGEGKVLYDSVRDVWLRTGLSPRVLERLADAALAAVEAALGG